jgi:hypothetical protein
VIAAAIPDELMLPTDECFAQEVPEPVCDGLICPKYDLWDSNPGSWLANEHKSGMAAAITTGHPMSNWRDEMQG